jgi:streptogramin lyase
MFETFRSSYRAAMKTKNRNVRLQLEELEGRCLLSSGFGPLGGITSGPDGDIWFLEKDRLGRIDPHTGLIQEFAQGIKTGNDPIWPGISIAEAPDGSIWFLSNHQVTRFTPSTNALDTFNLGSGSSPLDSLIVGPDGVVWVLEKQSETYGIARIDPATGNVQNYATGELQPGDPRVNSVPTGIAFGPDGKIWIGILYYGPEVMDPTTGVVQSWTAAYLPPITEPSPAPLGTIEPVPLGLSAPLSESFRLSGVILGQDSVARLVMPWAQPAPSFPPPWYTAWSSEWYGPTPPKIASDGSFWFFVYVPPIAADVGIAGYNPSTGHQMQFQVPGGAPIQLTPGPDGNIWYTYVVANGYTSNAVCLVGSFNPTTGASESFSPASQSQAPPSSTGNPPPATGTTLSTITGFGILTAVASFTPPGPIASPGSAYQATVDWGDGTTTSIVLTVTASGTYDVVASHAYQSAGTYNIKVTIGNFDPANPLGDNPITVFSTANVDPFNMNM